MPDAPLAQAPSPPHRRSLFPLLFFFAVLALVGYFVYGAVDGLVSSSALEDRVAEVRREIDELQWQSEQLGVIAGYLDSDEYVERAAREDLGLVRPGEEAFAVEAPLRPGLPLVRSPWWANLLPSPEAADRP